MVDDRRSRHARDNGRLARVEHGVDVRLRAERLHDVHVREQRALGRVGGGNTRRCSGRTPTVRQRSSTPGGRRFIGGVPMKDATNLFAGWS